MLIPFFGIGQRPEVPGSDIPLGTPSNQGILALPNRSLAVWPLGKEYNLRHSRSNAFKSPIDLRAYPSSLQRVSQDYPVYDLCGIRFVFDHLCLQSGKRFLSMKTRVWIHCVQIWLLGVVFSLAVSIDLPVLADEWTDQFLDPPASAGMTVYWIWFGPSVTKEGIDRDLANMRTAYISGATILPVYPLSAGDGPHGIRNDRFLSEEFLGCVSYAARRAKEIGLTLDLTPGSGWPYGGPWITPELGGKMIRLRQASDPLNANEELVATFWRSGRRLPAHEHACQAAGVGRRGPGYRSLQPPFACQAFTGRW